MERGSVQHGARIDDEMAHEVAALTHGAPAESRAREDLEAEPPADEEPNPDALISDPAPIPAVGLSHDDIEMRSEIARHLRPSAFPAERDALLVVAEAEEASDAVLALLASLPRGVEFHQVSDVWRALGGTVEHRPEDLGPDATAATREVGAGVADREVGERVEVGQEVEVGAGVEDRAVDEGDEVADVVTIERATTEPSAAPSKEPVTPEPSPAPGCNVAAIAAHVALDATTGAARALRRRLPFG